LIRARNSFVPEKIKNLVMDYCAQNKNELLSSAYFLDLSSSWSTIGPGAGLACTDSMACRFWGSIEDRSMSELSILEKLSRAAATDNDRRNHL
jgi:hypothetical protein